MTAYNKKWDYLAVKSLSALFRGKNSRNNADFICLNCLLSYRTKNKLKKHENICNNPVYCYMEMSKINPNILN